MAPLYGKYLRRQTPQGQDRNKVEIKGSAWHTVRELFTTVLALFPIQTESFNTYSANSCMGTYVCIYTVPRMGWTERADTAMEREEAVCGSGTARSWKANADIGAIAAVGGGRANF